MARELNQILESDPPRDNRAEMSVFACCLLDPKLCEQVAVDDFYLGMHGVGGRMFMELDEIREECGKGEDPTTIFLRRLVFNRGWWRKTFGGSVAVIISKSLGLHPRVTLFEEYLNRCREATKYRNEYHAAERRLVSAVRGWERHKAVEGFL